MRALGPTFDGANPLDYPRRTRPVPGDASRFSSTPLSRPLPTVYGTAWVEALPIFLDSILPGRIPVWKDSAGSPTLNGDTDGLRCRVQYAFCQGPITSIDWIKRDKVLFNATPGTGIFDFKYLSAVDAAGGTTYSYQPSFTTGTASTATVWTPLSGEASPAVRIPHGHLALMRCERFAMPDGRLPVLWGRVRGKFATYADPGISAESLAMTGAAMTVYNALPGDIIKDLLPAASIVTDAGTDGAAASSYDRYCHARGWYLGFAITEEQSVMDVVQMILAATDSALAISGSSWRVVPYGDTAITRGSYTYTPPTTSIGINDDDLVLSDPGIDPVELEQVAEEDTRNSFPVSYVPGYGWAEDEAPAESMDVASVTATDLRRAAVASLPCIRSAAHAISISGLLATRNIYSRTVARFSVNSRHPEVEPCDFISLTHAMAGISAKVFRVISTEEGENGATLIEAQEWNTGVSVVPVYNTQTADGLIQPGASGANPMATSVDAMASDSVFSASEHAGALTAWKDLADSSAGLVAKAALLGVSSSAWTTALTALGTYLNAGSAWTTGTPSWLAAPYVDVAITAATWRTNWDTAYLRRNQLLASFSPVLGASIVPTALSVTGTSGATATISTPANGCVVTPTNGTAPYSYAWTKVSGTTMTVTGTNAASFSLSLSNSSSASAVYRCTVTDGNEITATADVSVYLGNYGSAPPLSASASPTTAAGMGTGVDTQTVRSNYVTITPTGGTAPYSYALARLSGDTLTTNGAGTNYFRFTSVLAEGASLASVYRCTVTDNAAATVTVDVSVTLDN